LLWLVILVGCSGEKRDEVPFESDSRELKVFVLGNQANIVLLFWNMTHESREISRKLYFHGENNELPIPASLRLIVDGRPIVVDFPSQHGFPDIASWLEEPIVLGYGEVFGVSYRVDELAAGLGLPNGQCYDAVIEYDGQRVGLSGEPSVIRSNEFRLCTPEARAVE